MATRRTSSMQWEGMRAALSTAGVRVLQDGSVTPATGAQATYTVLNQSTRRVLVIHVGAASTPALGDIRFAYNATATATDFPILHNEYFRVDAAKDDTLSFWNTSGAGIQVFVLEVE